MNKQLLFLLLFLSTGLYAQQGFNCSSHQYLQQQLGADPVFLQNQQKLEEETQSFQLQHNKTAAGTKIIPVVFHIIHAGGSENISMAQIKNQIDILNLEYNRKMADTSLTPPPFAAVAGKLDVEFRLATKDPNGNCTNGVTRTYSLISNCSLNNNDVKSIIYWPSNKYLNIWVVAAMHYAGSLTCNGGGYAQFPGGSANTDGIVMRGDLIGSIGTATSNSGWGNFRGRYLIHESGHWFNLRHIWGDAQCGNDLVNDTPPAEGDNSGCPVFPHRPNNTCGAGANGEMFDNYMDYSQGACLNIFTQGQVTRMDAALNSSTSGRNNLWSPANLVATGTDVLSTPDCPPTPEMFPYTYRIICAGSSTTFSDISFGGTVSSRTWSFPGGICNNLNDSVATVSYANPGVYDVSLTVANNNGSNTKTFSSKVYVLDAQPNPNYTTPLTESFENPALFSNWYSIASPNDSLWRITSATNYTGSKCVMLRNHNTKAPSDHELISPAYDLSNLSSVSVKFRLHFSVSDTTDTDVLRVFVSNTCGVTWTQRYFKAANGGLNTTTQLHTTSYTPAAASAEWRLESFNVQNFMATSNFRLKFKFIGGGGNNIFIDDINITGTPLNGISELIDTEEASVFPNPSSGSFQVRLKLKQTVPVDVILTDISGRRIVEENFGLNGPGENNFMICKPGLAAGVYFINIRSGNLLLTQKKIIIE